MNNHTFADMRTAIDKHNTPVISRAEKNEKAAAVFVEAIKTIANKPENLRNLEHYLSIHFDAWLKYHASTPEDITCELREFAEMEL